MPRGKTNSANIRRAAVLLYLLGIGAGICVALPGPAPARADDGEAGIAMGSVEFKKSDAISMEKEDLFISMDKVKVAFDFKNNSDQDYTTLVAFPLPEQSCYEDECESVDGRKYNLQHDPWNGFNVAVNGKKIAFQKEVKAWAGATDVTALLAKYSVTLAGGMAALGQIEKLPDMAKSELAAAGAIKTCALDEEATPQAQSPYCPQWRIAEKYYWQQTFPADRITHIEHSYAPVAGSGEFFGFYAEDKNLKDYCIDGATQAAIQNEYDRKQKIYEKNPVNGASYEGGFNTIGYILKSANTWMGPIKDFHLTIEKPKRNTYFHSLGMGVQKTFLSTCFDGLKKTAPGKFEAWRQDFTPDTDISMIIYYE